MVTAGREEITRLLENKFDYIFTGASFFIFIFIFIFLMIFAY